MEKVKTKICYENELAGRLILHLVNNSTLSTNRLSYISVFKKKDFIRSKNILIDKIYSKCSKEYFKRLKPKK